VAARRQLPPETPQGISVFEDAESQHPPLIGLRVIVAKKLMLAIDGGPSTGNAEDEGLALTGRRS
jgi:hypothetical protein